MAYISGDGQIPIELRTIDSLVAQGMPAPDLIKIDVEGHELRVLLGGAESIQSHRPIILCDRNDDSTSKEVAELLAAFGYLVSGEFPIVCIPREASLA